MMCDVNSVPGLLKDFKFDLTANFETHKHAGDFKEP